VIRRGEDIAARIGAQAVARLCGRLAATIAVPGADVVPSARGVEIRGSRIVARARRDPALRWLARLVR
jgi:hypothetical protein